MRVRSAALVVRRDLVVCVGLGLEGRGFASWLVRCAGSRVQAQLLRHFFALAWRMMRSGVDKAGLSQLADPLHAVVLGSCRSSSSQPGRF